VVKHHTLLAGILVLFGGYILYIQQMPSRGLVGPDEPRYASIAREMAQSGDWVTPRLNGEPWFEKPALLYWLGAAADNFGIEDDQATRLPVALLSIAFLCFFYWQLRREFGPPAAAYATLILATSAGWVAYSQVGVFDIPLAVFVSSALLILLPWIANPSAANRWRIAAFGALLGAAFLAKGLVGPAIAFLALLSVCRDRKPLQVARDLFHPRALVSFAVLALPWYVLCYLQNGPAFLNEFFWRHHVDRIASESIQHVEPFWYYVPVLLGALLPWTPLLAAIPKADFRGDARLRFLLVWSAGTFVMFSLVTNKLPGYLLPLLPPLAALAGIRLAAAPIPRTALAAAAAAWVMLPLAERVLPGAKTWAWSNFTSIRARI
jgi:4-amino-4-deoxy-L-arabinose transferase-like glycosyltransferase